MLKKAFIRLIILSTLAFSLFFVLVSAQRARNAANVDCAESAVKTGNKTSCGELVLESIVGSVLVEIK